MVLSRIMNQPEDFKNLNINPEIIEKYEDGRRDTDAPGHGEIWYFDCNFDDGDHMVLGFRPKSVDHVNTAEGNPNVVINYTYRDGTPFTDVRQYTPQQARLSRTECDEQFGPHTLKGNNWQSYDVKMIPEPDQQFSAEGKTSIDHSASLALHFEAQTKPFRPGTGYISFGEHDEYYYNFICITALSITGTITLQGHTRPVSGTAYYNHQWFNISPINAFHHWLWGRSFGDHYRVMIFDMVAAEKFGLTQVPLFTIDDHQGQRIFESTRADELQLEVLDNYIQPETGKKYPLTTRYTFTQGATTVVFTIEKPKEIRTMNIYGDATKLVQQQFDQMHLKPTYSRYLAQTTLSITTHGTTVTDHASMLYEFNYPGIESADAHLF